MEIRGGCGQGSVVGHALYCRAVGMLGRGVLCRGLSVCVGIEREKGLNSRLWVWVEEASVQGCGYGQWVQGRGCGRPGLNTTELWEHGLV